MPDWPAPCSIPTNELRELVVRTLVRAAQIQDPLPMERARTALQELATLETVADLHTAAVARLVASSSRSAGRGAGKAP